MKRRGAQRPLIHAQQIEGVVDTVLVPQDGGLVEQTLGRHDHLVRKVRWYTLECSAAPLAEREAFAPRSGYPVAALGSSSLDDRMCPCYGGDLVDYAAFSAVTRAEVG